MKRAPHVCSTPGCPELITGSARYCSLHARDHRAPDTRPSSARRGYDAEWQTIRAAYLAAHPRCSYQGCPLPATEVHHKIAIKEGGTHDNNNLDGYCKHHHSQVTAHAQPGGFNKRLRANTGNHVVINGWEG